MQKFKEFWSSTPEALKHIAKRAEGNVEDCGSDVSMLNRAAQKANFPIEIEEACEPDRERFLWTDMSDMTSKQ